MKYITPFPRTTFHFPLNQGENATMQVWLSIAPATLDLHPVMSYRFCSGLLFLLLRVIPLSLPLVLLSLSSCGSGSESSERAIAPKIKSGGNTLTAFWDGKTQLEQDDRTFGDAFSMHFLSAHWENSTLFSYYIRTEALADGTFRTSTHLALSKDGVGFENQGRVLEGDASGARDTRIASFPSVIKRGGTWYMLYEGASDSSLDILGELRLAISADGINWDKHPDPVWVPAADWQAANVGTPTIWEENGTWYVLYHGYDGTKLQVGLLSGPDLLELTPANNNLPVLVTGSNPDDFDSGSIGKRSIREEDGIYYIVYEGSTREHPVLGWGGSHWGMGLARSYDLIHWEKYPGNPILRNPKLGFGYDGPEFVETPDGRLHIYFRNSSGSTSRATFK